MLTTLLLISCLSCRDGLPTTPVPPAPALAGAKLLGEVECVGEPRLRIIECRAVPGRAGGAGRALYGLNQVKLRSSNVSYDTTTLIFSFDVTVENLHAEPIGTPDGLSVTGIKVFYENGPTATSFNVPYDTGTITVANADGVQSFTGPDQPYHLYAQVLAPQQTSAAKPWHLSIPRSVNTFSFVLRVFTAVPSEPAVPVEIPTSWTMPRRYWDFENYRLCNVAGAGMCIIDAIRLGFRRNATQEERQSAINMVAGMVEGGEALLDMYYVRIPADTSLTTLKDALARLRSLPQVEYVQPRSLQHISHEYLRPDDGANWRDWQLSDSLADGRNWGLEAISAPLAWGCEVGSRDVPIAIVDSDFQSHPDLTSHHSSTVAGKVWR